MAHENRIGVGVACAVFRDQPGVGLQVLTSQRIGAIGFGLHALAGGWLESTDLSFERGADRELYEETGLERVDGPAADGVQAVHTVRTIIVPKEYDPDPTKSDFVTVYVFYPPGSTQGEPIVREPTKHAAWSWLTPRELQNLDHAGQLFPGVARAVGHMADDYRGRGRVAPFF